MVVFGNEGGQGYHWDGLVVIWVPYYLLALYDGYLGPIYGFCSNNVVFGNSTVPGLVLLNGLF